MPPVVYFYGISTVAPFLIIAALTYAILFIILKRGKPGLSREVSTRMAGVIYISLALTHFVLLRDLSLGRWWLLFALVIVWSNDTFAYYGGKNLGRTKLAPRISPNKTVEGAVCGIIGGVVAALIFVRLFKMTGAPQVTIVIAVVAGISGILGDLAESLIKRRVGVKDSGTLIPGHGGLLDRIDSLLFAVPTVYYMLIFMGRV